MELRSISNYLKYPLQQQVQGFQSLYEKELIENSVVLDRTVRTVAMAVFGALSIVFAVVSVPLYAIGCALSLFARDVVVVQPRALSPIPPSEDLDVLRSKQSACILDKFENLTRWVGDENTELKDLVIHFLEDHKEHKNTVEYTRVEHIRDELKSMDEALVLWKNKELSRGSDARGVIRMIADGNCWLYTVQKGLTDLGFIEAGYGHERLRREIVQEMRRRHDHDEELQNYVRDSVEAYSFNRRAQLDEESDNAKAMLEMGGFSEEETGHLISLIETSEREKEELDQFQSADYFTMMEQDRRFGGIAEFYVISKMYNLTVRIWREMPDNSLRSDLDPPLIGGNSGVIHAVLAKEGNHFNYLVQNPLLTLN